LLRGQTDDSWDNELRTQALRHRREGRHRLKPETEHVETFASFRDPVVNPAFPGQRRQALSQLDLNAIDRPIVNLVRRFNELPYCFTLQSCWGHFVCPGQRNPRNLQVLIPGGPLDSVEYRIAYMALCVENNHEGISLLQDLGEVPAIDPDYIQFGCADWFWQRQVNSYALQVEPKQHQTKDMVRIGHGEALHVQTIRDRVFAALEGLLDRRS
jgi:hypothetical protein